MTLKLLKITGQLFCRMSLNMGLSGVFSWLVSSYVFWAGIPQKWCYVLLTAFLFFFCLFVYLFWLCQVLVAAHRIFVVACRIFSCGMQDLSVAARGLLSCGMHAGSSSPTRDRTRASYIESAESYPLDHQGSPLLTAYYQMVPNPDLCHYRWY